MKKSKTVVRPTDDRVLVRALESVEKTPGGIVIPDNAREKPQRGVVVAVGPGKLLDSGHRAPMTVAVSDTVVYGKHAGSDIKIDDLDYSIMREAEILAVVEVS